MRLLWSLGILLVKCGYILAFFPNSISDIDIGDGTLTHYEITELGILKAVAAFFEAHPRPNSTITKGELTGMPDISPYKLFQRYYGADAAEFGFMQAIEEIASANEAVDVDHSQQAEWHFNGEAIRDANNKMVTLRRQILDVFREDIPNYEQAAELIGQFLHLLQMFYSNTNWVEANGPKPYLSLGIQDKPIYGTAPQALDTCRSCGDDGETCRDNLLTGKFTLTSGYRSGQNRVKPSKDPKEYQTGKCSHGGMYDRSARTDAALGGINKDSTNSKHSPHHHLHAPATQAAIDHTVYFFEDKQYGLRSQIGDSKYQRLLKLKSGNSLALVIDYSGSMSDDIEAVKRTVTDIIREVSGKLDEPSEYIIALFNDPTSLTTVSRFESGTEALDFLRNVSVSGGGDCPEFAMDGIEKALSLCQPNSDMYVSTDASAKDPEKTAYIKTLAAKKKVKITFLLTGDCRRRRRVDPEDRRTRRSVNGEDLFRSIANATGGSVYVTNKSGISKVTTVIKETVTTSVTLLKTTLSTNGDQEVSIPVDSTMRGITIKITTLSGEPVFVILNPDGTEDTSQKIIDIKDEIKIIKISHPRPGIWRLRRTGTNDLKVDVTARSVLGVSTRFLQTNQDTGFQYNIVGRPISGDNLTMIIQFPSMDLIRSLDRISVLDSNGFEFQKFEDNIQARSKKGKAVFRRHFVIPDQPFQIAVKGMDKDGHEFLRLLSENFIPVGIQLKMLPASGEFYINQPLTLPFRVTNKDQRSTTVVVTISDDQEFLVPPLEQTFQLEAGENKTGQFMLQAGEQERVTTTVTLTARDEAARLDNFQFAVRRFTTSKRIIRNVDNDAPTCSLLHVHGSCNMTIVDPCHCANHRWWATAEVEDDNSGIFQVSSSIYNEKALTVDDFKIGQTDPIQANVSGSCCDAIAYLTAVDMEGNTGQCFINVVTKDGKVTSDAKVIDMVKTKRPCQLRDPNDQVKKSDHTAKWRSRDRILQIPSGSCGHHDCRFDKIMRRRVSNFH